MRCNVASCSWRDAGKFATELGGLLRCASSAHVVNAFATISIAIVNLTPSRQSWLRQQHQLSPMRAKETLKSVPWANRNRERR